MLQNLGCQTNYSTGLHVHIGSTDAAFFPQVLRHICCNYILCEEAIDSLFQLTARVNNKYCRAICNECEQEPKYFKILDHCSYEELADVFNPIVTLENSSPKNSLSPSKSRSSGKYYKLNINPVMDRSGSPTVEFRQHHGTLDEKSVLFWIEFCHRFVYWSKYRQNFTRDSRMALYSIMKYSDEEIRSFQSVEIQYNTVPEEGTHTQLSSALSGVQEEAFCLVCNSAKIGKFCSLDGKKLYFIYKSCPLCLHPNFCGKFCLGCGIAQCDQIGCMQLLPHTSKFCPTCGFKQNDIQQRISDFKGFWRAQA